VWAVPLLTGLAVIAWRRRSAARGLAAAAAAAVFSRRIPLFWPGHPPGLVRLLEGDPYVLCGLAVLAGTALVLIRERVQATRQLAGPTRTIPSRSHQPAGQPLPVPRQSRARSRACGGDPSASASSRPRSWFQP
jgi:hypothetical protein